MIFLTGGTGFVGKALCGILPSEQLVIFGRRKPSSPFARFHQGDISATTDYTDALIGIDVVIHSAARVHMMTDDSSDPLEVYREVNTYGTLNLARQAVKAGVKRFIFVSSVKVNGEATVQGQAFRHDDIPAPSDAYGTSKAEAEAGLLALAKETGIEVVIVRPPLVYGPGVKANFAAMFNLARKNLPLPLGAIDNLRSLVAIDNLVDLIQTCIHHPKAANQIFLVSDDCDVSTTTLLKTMILACNKTPRLLPVPMPWIQSLAKIAGKSAIADRLCGSLQLDIQHTKQTLDWNPPLSFEEGIKRCVVPHHMTQP